MLPLFLLLACNSTDSTSAPPPASDTPVTATTSAEKKLDSPLTAVDQNQKHPPLPANNPAWEWNAEGFVPDFGWYGEHNWMDVRMRVSGHLSAAGRDLARLAAQQGKFAEAARHYQASHQRLAAIPSPSSGFSKEINNLLLKAAKRDENLLFSISRKESPTIPTSGEIAPLRFKYYALAIQKTNGLDVSAQAQQLQKSLQALQKPRPELQLDGFSDFISRHKLRVRLFAAYVDALDPLAIDERWGYWEAEEIDRQIAAIGLAAEQLGGDNWQSQTQQKFGAVDTSKLPKDPLLWPSTMVKQLRSSAQQSDSSAAEFGALPTGDSLIDVGGHPGPKGIGKLMKWDVSDPQHKQWLQKQAQQIQKAIQSQPEQAIQICRQAVKYLDSHSHGSRFYNIKQLRNATVRQLARNQHYQQAYTVLMDNFPLHHQDWACPNREGILLALAGRLQALSDATEAEATLQRSIKVAEDFLDKVNKAEKGLITSPRPPAMKPKGHGQQQFGTKRGHHNPPPNHRNAPPRRQHQTSPQ